MMNEINKLIWPSPDGIGIIDEAAWTRTVEGALAAVNETGAHLITEEPPATAWTATSTSSRRWTSSRPRATSTSLGEEFTPLEVELAGGRQLAARPGPGLVDLDGPGIAAPPDASTRPASGSEQSVA